jgi:hypothetical protein
MTAFAGVAEAKTNVQIGIGIGVPGWGHDRCYWDYNPRYCGLGYRPPGFYEPPRWRDPEPVYYGRVSCREARQIVRERGFRRVQTERCGGRYHEFIGLRRGEPYLIKVRSRNGAIRSIDPI